MVRRCLLQLVLCCAIVCRGSESERDFAEQKVADEILLIETVHGQFLSARYDDAGQSVLRLDSEGFEPGSEMQAMTWPGGIVLRSVQHEKVLGVRGGLGFFGFVQCPFETDCEPMGREEVFYVHEELVGSLTITLKTSNGIILGCNEQQCSAKHESEAGLNEMLLLRDDTLTNHMTQLRAEGYTVMKVLEAEEAADVRQLLNDHSAWGGSNGYQIRIPDVLVHHPVYAELLTHPRVLQLVRSYLGKYARCATWSSNTLLPGMDHPVLGWHVDYPYHDIEPGSWGTDVSLGLQVLWMIDDFREDNGGTMFLPGSHEWLTPPHIDDFSQPDGAEVLSAGAGHVLVAHSAWWHRQTQNTSPHPRHALLACFTRGFVVPKADMESQLERVASSGAYWGELDARQQHELRKLLLGPHGRAKRGYHA